MVIKQSFELAPLPDSGNIIGFLQILLKTELECSQLKDESEQSQDS